MRRENFSDLGGFPHRCRRAELHTRGKQAGHIAIGGQSGCAPGRGFDGIEVTYAQQRATLRLTDAGEQLITTLRPAFDDIQIAYCRIKRAA